MKKGFTLVELLGVVVVLSIVLILAVPNIINTFRRTNQNEFDSYVKNLKVAAENYVERNRNFFEQFNHDGGKAFISIKQLEDEGLIRNSVVDPEDEEGRLVDNNFTIVVERNDDGMLEYSFERFEAGIDIYNQNGLILHYDVLNNNGIGYRINHYIQDLSNSNNDVIAIDDSRWTLNSLLFSSSDDAIKSNKEINSSLLGDRYTIEVVLSQNGGSNTKIGFEDFIELRLTTSAPSWNFGGTTRSFGTPYTQGNKYRFAVANNNDGTSRIFLNDHSVLVNSSVNIDENSRFIIGNETNPFIGELHAIRIYNRQLSTEELNRNYQIDSNRFDF